MKKRVERGAKSVKRKEEARGAPLALFTPHALRSTLHAQRSVPRPHFVTQAGFLRRPHCSPRNLRIDRLKVNARRNSPKIYVHEPDIHAARRAPDAPRSTLHASLAHRMGEGRGEGESHLLNALNSALTNLCNL